MKKKYIAPEILEEVRLEMDGQILSASSNVETDKKFEKVETMGQEIGGTITENDWQQKW